MTRPIGRLVRFDAFAFERSAGECAAPLARERRVPSATMALQKVSQGFQLRILMQEWAFGLGRRPVYFLPCRRAGG